MIFRPARKEDIFQIVRMLADDKLGQLREDYRDPLPESYYDAFDEIENNPDIELIVAESDEGEVVGTLQLYFVRNLTYRGGLRAHIEGVRIRRDLTGQGFGKELFEWAIERARQRGAHVLQLTTDKQRPEAKHFYEELGFKDSHAGMKFHY